MHRRLFALAFVLPLAACSSTGTGVSHVIRVKKAAGPIAVDGRLDEAAWKDAAIVSLRSADGSKEASRATRVRALHDGAKLYVAFECEDPDIWTDHRGRDSWMWTEDVVEAFIQPHVDRAEYIELEVNPFGDLFDGMFFQHRGSVLMSWNPAIEAAASVDGTANRRDDADRSWTVEMAIPAADLAPAGKLGEPAAPIRSGGSWKINFYRNERSGSAPGELQAWAPVRGDFHEVGFFGLAVFE